MGVKLGSLSRGLIGFRRRIVRLIFVGKGKKEVTEREREVFYSVTLSSAKGSVLDEWNMNIEYGWKHRGGWRK
jgi:hypothetical protein